MNENWSDFETKYLKDNWGLSNRQLAVDLNRNTNSIYKKKLRMLRQQTDTAEKSQSDDISLAQKFSKTDILYIKLNAKSMKVYDIAKKLKKDYADVAKLISILQNNPALLDVSIKSVTVKPNVEPNLTIPVAPKQEEFINTKRAPFVNKNKTVVTRYEWTLEEEVCMLNLIKIGKTKAEILPIMLETFGVPRSAKAIEGKLNKMGFREKDAVKSVSLTHRKRRNLSISFDNNVAKPVAVAAPKPVVAVLPEPITIVEPMIEINTEKEIQTANEIMDRLDMFSLAEWKMFDTIHNIDTTDTNNLIRNRLIKIREVIKNDIWAVMKETNDPAPVKETVVKLDIDSLKELLAVMIPQQPVVEPKKSFWSKLLGN